MGDCLPVALMATWHALRGFWTLSGINPNSRPKLTGVSQNNKPNTDTNNDDEDSNKAVYKNNNKTKTKTRTEQ